MASSSGPRIRCQFAAVDGHIGGVVCVAAMGWTRLIRVMLLLFIHVGGILLLLWSRDAVIVDIYADLAA